MWKGRGGAFVCMCGFAHVVREGVMRVWCGLGWGGGMCVCGGVEGRGGGFGSQATPMHMTLYVFATRGTSLAQVGHPSEERFILSDSLCEAASAHASDNMPAKRKRFGGHVQNLRAEHVEQGRSAELGASAFVSFGIMLWCGRLMSPQRLQKLSQVMYDDLQRSN